MKAFLRPVSFALAFTVLAVSAPAQQLTFKHAMELALQRASASTAAADQQRAHAAYQEARSMFLPQLVVGSGLGKSFGYPMSIEGAAPSVFQVNYQSFLYNPAQNEFIRSARQAWMASASTTEDHRAATLLEAALTYIQLDTISSRSHLLRTQQQEAERLVQIVSDRVREGIDSEIDLTRARLDAARVRMRAADTAGAADVLRERLAQLTGLPAASIETVTESIPSVPDVSREQNLIDDVVKTHPIVKAADLQASAQEFRAKGEHRALLPAFDLVGDYGYFTRYNNFDKYFNRFQHNNATVGVAIRFPFLNFPQRARAEQADADALRARRLAEVTKNQVSTETLRLARAVQQLAAADEVAKLDYELTQAESGALETRVQAAAPGAPAGQGAPAPGPRDVQAARIQTNDKYSVYLDTSFELQKAKLQLLRASGRLESWATGGATP
jgi:outer membrane protein TolC